MLLKHDNCKLFFKLYWTLLAFVNQQRLVLPILISSPDDVAQLRPEKVLRLRNALLSDIGLIQSFVDANPANLSREELDIVSSWKHYVSGSFYIFRELKQYTIFLDGKENSVAYGVTALSQPFEDLVGPYLPVLIETVLLPFQGKIIYDGILAGPGVSISFGPGIRRSLNEDFRTAKSRYGIVTSLPVGKLTASPAKPVKSKKTRRPAIPKDDAQEVLNLIVGMTDEFCRKHLHEEYAALCRKLAEKLARKRPSPLLSGKPNVWACGIIRSIGMVNFLSDPSQKPTLKLAVIDQAFGVGESTASGKSAAIRKLLKITRYDHHWILPSRLDDDPLVWLLSVNGFMMDIRKAPRGAQEAAYEKGLIPYIPADRADGE